jgi:NAD(P)-dependent dehydrogenase (short-subunit alcohol dehydrogenase family)
MTSTSTNPAAPLAGQVGIVTGAGRGLGRAHALELASRGCAVVVNDVAGAGDVVSEIEAAGGRAAASAHDITSADAGAALVATAVDTFGTLDILVNNAGIMRAGYFEDLTTSDYDEMMDLHLRALFNVTKPAWRIFQEKRYGRVMMTSSSSGMFGWPGAANYSAVKGGVYGLTRALAMEGAEFGINVNVLLPWAASRMGENNPIPDLQAMYKFFVGTDLPREHWRQDARLTARLVAYLVDPSCQVTGEVYSSCRGRFARVFVAATEGWVAPDIDVTVEDIAKHIDEIRSDAHYVIPGLGGVFEELAQALRQVGRQAGPDTDAPLPYLPRAEAADYLATSKR